MVTYVFPGQGSQYKGMGGALFDEFPEITTKADMILGYSIKELCLKDFNRQLSLTQYTQPALYTVNLLSYLKKIKETDRKPDYMAGHSLGEYSALCAAGVFDFETGLKLVKKRGELMSQAVGGGMAAVLGLNEDAVEEILKKNGLETVEIANYNTPTQIVVSGAKDDVERARSLFAGEGVTYIPLNVSGAFHTRYMKDAQQKFQEYLDRFAFSELTIPVVSNVYARVYKSGTVKKLLAEQIIRSVKWSESIRYLMGLGEMEFEEIGPGDVLTKLIKKIQEQAEPLVVSPDKSRSAVNDVDETKSVWETKRNHVRASITALSLGNEEFKRDYNLKYAYLVGGMYRGISSKAMIVKMGKAGMLGFFGTGGLQFHQIEETIQSIQEELSEGQAYGMNLVFNPNDPQIEETIVDLCLKYNVRVIEAAAYMSVTSSLIRYRAHGLKRNKDGTISVANRIIAKLSRPEVAEAFISPPPEQILDKMVRECRITPEQAELLRKLPVADELCVEADSGGHTDGGVAYALMPAIIKLRDEMMKKYGYSKNIRVGAAGGIGAPEAAAAALIMGADFIVTGSINQCTVEAGTSDAVKDLLQQMNVQDTEYAPAGDMFEMGARVQVLRRGVLFPARANKLYDLYRLHSSIQEIDEMNRKLIQERYFKRSFEKVYEEVKRYYPQQEIDKAEQNPKYKMALIFKWYFGYCSNLALNGNPEQQVDYQIHCGPALGAFNQWVKGTTWENWRNRHVDEIALKLMEGTAELLNHRIKIIAS